MVALNSIVTLVVLMSVSTVVKGYILSTLWGWFIIPTFTGAPGLGIVPAMGIGLVVSCLTFNVSDKKFLTGKKLMAEAWHIFVFSNTMVLLLLAMGYIVRLFM